MTQTAMRFYLSILRIDIRTDLLHWTRLFRDLVAAAKFTQTCSNSVPDFTCRLTAYSV